MRWILDIWWIYLTKRHSIWDIMLSLGLIPPMDHNSTIYFFIPTEIFQDRNHFKKTRSMNSSVPRVMTDGWNMPFKRQLKGELNDIKTKW